MKHVISTSFLYRRYFLSFLKLLQDPRGYFHIRRSGGGGGLDFTLSLEEKFGERSSQVHQIRGKSSEVLHKNWEKILILL